MGIQGLKQKRVFLALTLGAGVSVAAPALAEGWFWQPTASMTIGQSDNVRFSATNPISAAFSDLGAGILVSAETQTSRVSLTPSVRVRRYASHSELNTTDVNVAGKAAALWERAEIGVGGKVGKDTTLTSEFEDSGNLRQNVDRQNTQLAPYFMYQLSPISRIRADVDIRAAAYDNGEIAGYYDYTRLGGGLAYQLAVTSLDQIEAKLYANQYESDYLDNKTSQSGLQIGYQHSFSETTSGALRAGYYRLDAERSVGGRGETSANNGAIYEASLSHKLPLTAYTASVSSQLEPSSIGEVRKINRADLSISHQFTERLGLELQGLLFRNTAVGEGTLNDDRDYSSLRAGIGWRLDPYWTVLGDVRRLTQKYDNRDADADATEFGLSLRFNGLKQNF